MRSGLRHIEREFGRPEEIIGKIKDAGRTGRALYAKRDRREEEQQPRRKLESIRESGRKVAEARHGLATVRPAEAFRDHLAKNNADDKESGISPRPRASERGAGNKLMARTMLAVLRQK